MRHLTLEDNGLVIHRVNSVNQRYFPSGVPQGSIIGPLLFLIFINDIADDISTDTSIPLYADDAKCHRKLLDPADQAILQSDLNTIVDWSELWGMSYNASKCKHLSLTKKQTPLETTYFLAGNILSKSACEKDLGVLVNSKLSWHDHIVNKVNKANRVLRLIRRTCGTHANTDVIKKLYIHLVRPHLDYASQVWSPHQAYLSNTIEGAQRRATKLMVGSKLSYSDRLLKTGLMSLSSRRIYLDLLFLFKCLHG